MCSLTNFSYKKNIFDIFLNSLIYRVNHIFPAILMKSRFLFYLFFILETWPQSSKNDQKFIKICEIHDGDKSTMAFGFQ